MNYRLTYRDIQRIRSRQRRQRIAIAIALIAALTVVTVLAAVKPALGATDGPFVRRHRVCIHRDILVSSGSPQISMCVKWSYR